MDDLDAARGLSPWPTPPHEDSVSTSSTDTINLEDGHYSALRAELAADALDLEGESWSVAVDQQYVNSLHQDAVKRQDVIYELIQTEVHHVRTLKLLLSVYQYELRQSLQMEETRLERMFPQMDNLLHVHQRFLWCLRDCRDRHNHHTVTQLGDILINQFSGEMGERMKESYGVFCSHHNDAVSFYKEQLQNNKKFQNLMTKIGRLSVVRRLGVPECILLVTQRITKYPVLVERILLNTVADSEEHSALAQALVLIRETISAVDSQVHDYERASRLRDIGSRLEPRSQGRWKDGRVFTRDDLAEGSRTLLHEGTVSCRAANGRLKDIHAVLLSDVLLLLQKEKDQKLIFVNVDNKPSVISLQMLIVREMAHEDKAMFLISASSSKPEMYEIHTSSREDCNAWMSLIRDAVDSCPAMEEQLNSEQEEARLARLRDFRERLYMKDAQIVQSLTEKLQMFADMAEAVTGLENVAAHSRLLLRTDASDIQQGETLLKGAVTEVENLQNLLLSGVTVRDPHPTPEDSLRPRGFSLRPEVLRLGQGGLGLGRLGNLAVLRRAETFGGYDCNPPTPIKYGSIPAGERPGSVEGRHQRSNSDPQLQDLDQSESLELSLFYRVLMLSHRLYGLQAIVSQQDSHIELQRASILERERPGRPRGNMLLDQEKQRNLEKQREEMADFHKLQTQHRQNQARWEKERERHRLQAEVLEAELRQREEECRRLEEKLEEEREELERQRETYQQDLERLRESTRTVEKQKEHLNTQMKLKQNKTITNPGSFNFKTQQSFRRDPPLSQSFRGDLPLSQSFRGDLMGGLTTGREVIQTPKVHVRPSLSVATNFFLEQPPEVPPRRESISPGPPKPEFPIHLISTTNQVVHKPGAVQQQIPTKLAALGNKGKEKSSKKRPHHQRTHSAASIEMSQVVPIRVTGNESRSLRGKKTVSPHRNYQSDCFFSPPEPLSNAKPTQTQTLLSSSSMRNTQSQAPPPEPPPPPPPFPKDITSKPTKEHVIYL
ncbi:rho guanine nucleotide exchange factor 18-like isoform X2 [Coregonus clupeaformis]|uniref:rho guanine nucleotide exchange factor 18-like isoform X2 n=1 Tax=Coregonus clupeaformis TaxID=59861 RepID=UPI001E1C761D|nr:rho guanine nucleotide exchange factor 18-like isoform X2 [Coregonus clupeaformis]